MRRGYRRVGGVDDKVHDGVSEVEQSSRNVNERKEVEQAGLKKELVKLKGWVCCNGQRKWGGISRLG